MAKFRLSKPSRFFKRLNLSNPFKNKVEVQAVSWQENFARSRVSALIEAQRTKSN